MYFNVCDVLLFQTTISCEVVRTSQRQHLFFLTFPEVFTIQNFFRQKGVDLNGRLSDLPNICTVSCFSLGLLYASFLK